MKNEAVILTDPLSVEMLDFEKHIAYFFNVKNPEAVAYHYIQALKEMEQLGKKSDENTLRMHLVPHLQLAYQEVAKQKQLQFNIEKAAELEYELFMGSIRNSTFENDYQILVKIYETVFQKKSPRLLKAAMLRAFLYKYKIAIFESTEQLAPSDQQILLKLAKASEDEMILLENEM